MESSIFSHQGKDSGAMTFVVGTRSWRGERQLILVFKISSKYVTHHNLSFCVFSVMNRNGKSGEGVAAEQYLRVHIQADDDAYQGSLPIASAQVSKTIQAQKVARAAWKTVAK